MNRPLPPPAPRWAGALALAIVLAACSIAPGGVTGRKSPPTRPATVAKASPTPKASPSVAPSPLPSLGLLIAGQVRVEPAKLLADQLAASTGTGIKLLGNNGAGLISNNGLGIISNNGAGVVSNDAGSYRVAAADDGLEPVEGMHVSAVALVDGRVLAGPVATDAEGRYRLGFLQAPGANFRVVASVPAKPKEPAFTYATLVAPKAAPSAAPVVTSDASRAVTDYLLGVLPVRMQPVIDARKQGRSAEAYIATYSGALDADVLQILTLMDKALARAPVAALGALDGSDGQLARGLSERAIAFIDLRAEAYVQAAALAEELHQVGERSSEPPETSLADQVLTLARAPGSEARIVGLLTAHGLSDAEAAAYHTRLEAVGALVAADVGKTAMAHQAEVLGPLAAVVGFQP